MDLSSLVMPAGLLSFLLLLATILTGLRLAPLKIHRTLAWSLLLSATLHAGLVLYLTYRR